MTMPLPSHAVPASGLCEWCGVKEEHVLQWDYDLKRWLCSSCHHLHHEGKLLEMKTNVIKSGDALTRVLQELEIIPFIKIICPKCVQHYGIESAFKCNGMQSGKESCSLWSDVKV